MRPRTARHPLNGPLCKEAQALLIARNFCSSSCCPPTVFVEVVGVLVALEQHLGAVEEVQIEVDGALAQRQLGADCGGVGQENTVGYGLTRSKWRVAYIKQGQRGGLCARSCWRLLPTSRSAPEPGRTPQHIYDRALQCRCCSRPIDSCATVNTAGCGPPVPPLPPEPTTAAALPSKTLGPRLHQPQSMAAWVGCTAGREARGPNQGCHQEHPVARNGATGTIRVQVRAVLSDSDGAPVSMAQ